MKQKQSNVEKLTQKAISDYYAHIALREIDAMHAKRERVMEAFIQFERLYCTTHFYLMGRHSC